MSPRNNIEISFSPRNNAKIQSALLKIKNILNFASRGAKGLDFSGLGVQNVGRIEKGIEHV